MAKAVLGGLFPLVDRLLITAAEEGVFRACEHPPNALLPSGISRISERFMVSTFMVGKPRIFKSSVK